MPAKQQCRATIEVKVQLSEVENHINMLLEGEAICPFNIHFSCITCISLFFLSVDLYSKLSTRADALLPTIETSHALIDPCFPNNIPACNGYHTDSYAAAQIAPTLGWQ